MAEDQKIEIRKSELEDLIRQKAEEIVEERRDNTSADEKREAISRRSFLKKLGVGVAGLSTLSLAPASALNIRSNGLTFYGGENSETDLNVDNSGNLTLHGDLTDENGNTIWNSTSSEIPSNSVQSSGLDADTVRSFAVVSSGGEAVQVPSYTSTSDVPNIPEGSLVYIENDNSFYYEDGK
jgi:hypothetical protein